MILAIETSCDDSAVALLDLEGNVLANEISSQVQLHEKYGGVVPELASRSHLQTLPLLIRHVLTTHQISLKDLTFIAATSSPGLVGSLLIGVSYAKTLAWTAGIPLIPVDHLEGHLLAPFLDNPDLAFPYLGLIVSGGHTHLIQVNQLGNYTLIGKTLDDAAGEAFDKVAKMTGFKYPGGPIIDKISQECEFPSISFPIPLRSKKVMNFSYAGLKTAVRNHALKEGLYVTDKKLIGYEEFKTWPENSTKDRIRDIFASFQKTVAETLAIRCNQALKVTGLNRLALTGGVAANSEIKTRLQEIANKRKSSFHFPSLRNCTDNAAMIGYTALQYWKQNSNHGLDLSLNASSKSPLNQMEVTPLLPD